MSYGQGSTTGTTTSGSNTYKEGASVTFEASEGLLETNTATASFGYSRSDTWSDSVDVKKSANFTIETSGPGEDGINHDYDMIYLWLNPTVRVNVDGNAVGWKFIHTEVTDYQIVYVGWLNGHMQMPNGVKQRLSLYNISDGDYAGILSSDPLISGSQTLDPGRFAPIHMTFPYEPPLTESGSTPTAQYKLDNSSTSTAGHAAENETKVGASWKGGMGLSIVKATFKSELSFTWTNKSSSSSSTGTSEAATATIGGPSFGYNGPTDLEVYYDKIFKTFSFRFMEGKPIALRGLLTNAARKPLPGKEVVLIASGVRYRTYTDRNGNYRFFGVRGSAKVMAPNTPSVAIPTLGPSKKVDLQAQR